MARDKEDRVCGCAGASSDLQDGLEELDAVIQKWKTRPGALMPVLQAAQQMCGYLSDAVMERVSQGLGIPKATVFGVATFYAFFSRVPRGKYVICVCMGTACYVRGGQHVLEALETELGITVGETTKDRLFSLETRRCFGACGLAPAIMVNETGHARVKPSDVRDLLTLYRSTAQRRTV